MTDEEKRKREEEERRMRELYERSQQAKINPPTGSNNAGIEEGSSFGQPENDEGTIKGGAKGTLLNGVEGYDNITKPAEKSEPQELSGYQKVLEAYKKRQMINDALDARGQSRSVVAGIGDLARSLANLYYVNRYAPNAYDPTKTMSARQREIFEKAKANRDANLDQWMHYVLNVAGKKDAAAQAERNRQDRLAQQRAAAEAKAKELQDKEDQQWVSDYLVPDWKMEYDKYDDVAKAKAAIEADLDDRYKKGMITDGQLAAAKKRLEPTLIKRKEDKYFATEKQNRSIETSQRRAAATAAARGNNGGGNRSNTHQYVGFADGSGVWINKNDVSDITSLYDRADFPEAYKAKDGYGNVKTNLSREDKLNAVIHYLSLNRNNAYENWLRQVEKRPRTAKPQQPKQTIGQSGVNWKTQGTTKINTGVNWK